MTLENCKRLLEHYKKSVDDSTLSQQARLNMKIAIADMEENIKARGGFSEPKPKKK